MSIQIMNINTKPEINDLGQATRTIVWFNPDNKQIGVEQEFKTNSTPFNRYNGFELYWPIKTYPSEEVMREWLEENMDLFETICGGFEIDYKNGNKIGVFDAVAKLASEKLEEELIVQYAIPNYYEIWDTDEWVDHNMIYAEMTDEEILDLATQWRPVEDRIVLTEDIYTFISDLVDFLNDTKE